MMESKQSQADKPEFVKYPRIKALGSSSQPIPLDLKTIVSVFEKIDGGNCQIRNRNWQLLPGCKANYLTNMNKENFEWFEKLLKWTYSNNSLYNLPEDIVVFGEWTGNHTIRYGPAFSDRFAMIDVLDLNSKRFVEYSDAVKFLQEKKIEGVHILEPLITDEIGAINIEKLVMEPSSYYDGPREGIVIKSYTEPQAYFKAYHPDFAESRDEGFGNIDHLTSVRFRKAFYGICEETGSRAVSLERLIETVAENVKDEHDCSYPINQVRDKLNDYLSLGQLSGIKNFLDF